MCKFYFKRHTEMSISRKADGKIGKHFSLFQGKVIISEKLQLRYFHITG